MLEIKAINIFDALSYAFDGIGLVQYNSYYNSNYSLDELQCNNKLTISILVLKEGTFCT